MGISTECCRLDRGCVECIDVELVNNCICCCSRYCSDGCIICRCSLETGLWNLYKKKVSTLVLVNYCVAACYIDHLLDLCDDGVFVCHNRKVKFTAHDHTALSKFSGLKSCLDSTKVYCYAPLGEVDELLCRRVYERTYCPEIYVALQDFSVI